MAKENPMLQTLTWTREDMSVAQDWELERRNEGALLWNSLGPELARVVCENPEALGMFGLFGGIFGRTLARPWPRTKLGSRSWQLVWPRARARVGEEALMRAWAWVGCLVW